MRLLRDRWNRDALTHGQLMATLSSPFSRSSKQLSSPRCCMQEIGSSLLKTRNTPPKTRQSTLLQPVALYGQELCRTPSWRSGHGLRRCCKGRRAACVRVGSFEKCNSSDCCATRFISLIFKLQRCLGTWHFRFAFRYIILLIYLDNLPPVVRAFHPHANQAHFGTLRELQCRFSRLLSSPATSKYERQTLTRYWRSSGLDGEIPRIKCSFSLR